MRSQNASYHFGRLNIIAVFSDKKRFLLEGLNTTKILRKSSHLWGFFDIEEVSFQDHGFISGYLVKLRPASDEETADIDTHQLKHEELLNKTVAKSLFFLDANSGLIAYHPAGRDIDDPHFRAMFAKLFEEAYEGFFVDVQIQTVEERLKIFEALKRFSRIIELDVYLHPSNPRYSSVWKRVDDRMKMLNASSYTERYKSRVGGEGLKVDEDDEIRSKITMADDGYGEAKVKGQLGDKTLTVSTGDNPLKAEAPIDDQDRNQILSFLWDTFESIRSRFRE